jgi:hypothetical protein
VKRSTGLKFGLVGLMGGVGIALYFNGSFFSNDASQPNESIEPVAPTAAITEPAQSLPTAVESHPTQLTQIEAGAKPGAQTAPTPQSAPTSPIAATEPHCKTFQFKVGPQGAGFSAKKMGQFRHRIQSNLEGLSSVEPSTACLNVGKRTVKHGLTRAKNGSWELTFGAVATAQSIASFNVCRKNVKRESPCKVSKNLAFASMGLDENGESDDASAKGFNSAAGQDGMSAQVEREMTRELAGESDTLAFFEGWEAVSQ